MSKLIVVVLLGELLCSGTVWGQASGDPRRIGVRPTGSYWGAAGEQIDLLSGNLNFWVPPLTVKPRSGADLPFGLSYNSQIWRQNSTPINLVGKAASQSSTYGTAIAAKAVDGNTDGNYFDGSISHTRADPDAWWQVDLGASANISSIVMQFLPKLRITMPCECLEKVGC